MPELPEVETVVRTLRPLIAGRTIAAVELHCPKLLRRAPDRGLGVLVGRHVESVRRRGKLVLIGCGDLTLAVHLKMTGRLVVRPESIPRGKHTHMVVTFADSGAGRLHFDDIRKFGFLCCVPTPSLAAMPEVAALGPEPLSLPFPEFERRLASHRGRIKALLLDQSFLAGLGNIYVDEILFAARVHPLTPAHRLRRAEAAALWRSMRSILRRAIAAKGSSIRDYTDATGTAGRFQERHRVYGREGKPCPRCGAAIRRIRAAGRSAWFCPACQRKRA